MNVDQIVDQLDEVVLNLPRSAAIQWLERISAEAKQRIINLKEDARNESSEMGRQTH